MSVSETAKSPWGESKRKRGNQFPVKREAVLAAAAGLFRHNGYNGASLADLADTLNITKPTLYYYVGSKEELFAEIISRAQNTTLEFMREIAGRDATGIEKLRAIMFSYAEMNTSDFGACVFLSLPSEMSRTIAREIDAKAREANTIVYEVLAQGEKDGTLRALDSAIVLHTVFGALNWMPRWYKPTGRMSLRKILELQVDMLINGIRGPAAQDEAAPKRSSRTRKA